MLIEKIDVVDAEPLQRRLADFADVIGPAVQAGISAILDPVAEFRRDDALSRLSLIALPTSTSLANGP